MPMGIHIELHESSNKTY